MKATRPKIKEDKLAALFEYVCKMETAQELAFYVILMSGPNHAFGHYHKHDRILKNGDFIILDAGPDYKYYNADISSTFPANGKFSSKQKKIYEMAYGIRKTCLSSYRPGITFKDVGEKVKQFLIKNGYDPADRQFRGLIRYGGYNHSIGLATHDPMGTFSGPEEIMRPGFVFACDINLPYPDQEMGIRLEDTVVITKNGCENLSDGIPRTIDEIEALMKKK
jgi:Xaa-Pro aminopeptidase